MHIFTATEAMLRSVLLRHHQHRIASQLKQRNGYEDLDGFDMSLGLSHDDAFSKAECEQLMIVRDGTFFTASVLSKFDARKTTLCVWCNVPDTKEHRFTICCRYDEIRARHQELFQIWDELPKSFRLTGLVPQNPWSTLVSEAFIGLPDQTAVFEFMPHGNVWHAFTDGTCSNPDSPEDSLAAWAVVIANRGTVSFGPLRGIQQCILRAEITGVLSALKWGAGSCGELHIWTDNQTVVDHMRDLLAQTGDIKEYEHQDLWEQVRLLLNVSLADVYVHKVAPHTDEMSSVEPMHDFARTWNSVVDFQAGLANLYRPVFFTRVWDRYIQFRTKWKRRVGMISSFFVDIARVDCGDTNVCDPDEADEVATFSSELCIEEHPNQALFCVHLRPLLDNQDWFLPSHDSHFISVSRQLVVWLHDQDQRASTMRWVSLIELYVVFRREFGGCVSGVHCDYLVPTFATDFRVFKAMLTHILSTIDQRTTHMSGHLTGIGIHVPQSCIEVGFTVEASETALLALRNFVGQRPITCAQGFSRPFLD